MLAYPPCHDWSTNYATLEAKGPYAEKSSKHLPAMPS
jgi:hypothetical protein